MSNIRDIAKLANVSVTTVSRVLNNHPYVSKEKREAVLRAIEALNYHKNINAVHLSRGKTNIIGVVIPFINHPYFSLLLEGISVEAQNQGYKIMILQTNYDIEKEMEALEMLKLKQVDALIITSRTSPLEVIKEYCDDGKIVLCEEMSGERFSSVFINHYKAFQEGINFLIENGHRYIGYCVGRRDGKSSVIRKKAYTEAMNRLGEPVREEWIFTNCLYIEDGERVVADLLKLNKAPTALLVTNDLVAAGIILECRKKGIQIPGQLAIVGFENHSIAQSLDITTIELPLRMMGEIAFKKSIANEPKSHTEIPFRLIQRNTV
ncbi:LacI family DNA-binding transcriptional regulator [Bacillus alveayuensis]|jgi:LacI family transcriptional regulator, repressor for deo operon, udp, cdd, tsx, nupC, and nupG|uniref:LacI family DNA-binding transcriptional regulator n=1 Tax=Aeribacillus alveayuensis TaxID=279215 RepID=UPI0005CD9CDF|nr:LacI family DNA-binding transcriptional regulator [Bacillus alveayuensis]